MNDIVFQQNHGGCMTISPDGAGWQKHRSSGPFGCDHHVICDDGSDLRDLPWCRDGREFSTGHSCWLGPTEWYVNSYCTYNDDGSFYGQLMAGKPMVCPENLRHTGRRLPGAGQNRVVLTREITEDINYKTLFGHFGFDPTGAYYVSDLAVWEGSGKTSVRNVEKDTLCIGRLTPPPDSSGISLDAAVNHQPLCRTGSVWIDQETHPHPALSPDRKTIIFNSGSPGKTPQILVAHVTEDMFI